MVMVNHYRLLMKTDSTELVGRKKLFWRRHKRLSVEHEAGGRSKITEVEIMRHLAVGTEKWMEEICIKQKQALEIG